ncbi:uncharacterized protein F54F2.9-like [Varroa jacobsoni]|uniref:Uncharacterized protein n=1 Tax=Varroa destructor TaxID=109461 RepID=A0A7M7JG88_VARDE|nr:uncharacterized protein F54F2.9-like [Varroa destructor]XP_022703477.1 uncharacterized protein F54F2.9-like [Varroa jacobsoni]
MKLMFLVTLIFCEITVIKADLTVEDLDLFDVVEDVKQNFYEFLEISENATTADIRKAYRKLSLQYHPDRNADPEAPEIFRKIAAVMEVLKDERKRAKYHEILQYGIPDWARSMYYRYYRKARKMGPLEMSVMMSILITVAQTLWMWASYWEAKFTIQSNVNEAIKRKKQRSTNAKKNKAAEEEIQQIRQELMSRISAPSFKDIWFIRLPYQLFCAFVALPGCVKELAAKKKPVEEGSEKDDESMKPKRTPRQRQPVKAAEVVNGTAPVVANVSTGDDKQLETKRIKQGPWGDNEVTTLIRLLKKYPIGSVDRWEKIAEALTRSPQDILDKVKSMRTVKTNVIPDQQNSSKSLFVESGISTKELDDEENKSDNDGDYDETSAGSTEETDSDPTAWTASQQKQLELAMVAFPKWTEGRWDLIASRVDGKSKKACIERVRWLIEKRKEKVSGETS